MIAFTADHAVDDPAPIEPMEEWAAYGPRKAECDRVCFAAAEDGASAMAVRPTFVLRTVAERGTPCGAYNVGARQLLTLDGRLELVANALGDPVELVHASERELARYGLTPIEFPLVRPEPSPVASAKLASLGRDSTPHAEAIPVEDHLASERSGRHQGPGREFERDAIDGLPT